MATARKPTVFRIPNLKVPHITFIYGEYDWMDLNGGLDVQRICDEKKRTVDDNQPPPEVDVLVVKGAGHLLMLENWEEFNNAILYATFSKNYVMEQLSPTSPQPIQLHYSTRTTNHNNINLGHSQSQSATSTAGDTTATTPVPSLES
jgi:hypothetical protein